jgi:hypothetical protein
MIVLRRVPFSGIGESGLQHSDYFIVRAVPQTIGVAGLGYGSGAAEFISVRKRHEAGDGPI